MAMGVGPAKGGVHALPSVRERVGLPVAWPRRRSDVSSQECALRGQIKQGGRGQGATRASCRVVRSRLARRRGGKRGKHNGPVEATNTGEMPRLRAHGRARECAGCACAHGFGQEEQALARRVQGLYLSSTKVGAAGDEKQCAARWGTRQRIVGVYTSVLVHPRAGCARSRRSKLGSSVPSNDRKMTAWSGCARASVGGLITLVSSAVTHRGTRSAGNSQLDVPRQRRDQKFGLGCTA